MSTNSFPICRLLQRERSSGPMRKKQVLQHLLSNQTALLVIQVGG